MRPLGGHSMCDLSARRPSQPQVPPCKMRGHLGRAPRTPPGRRFRIQAQFWAGWTCPHLATWGPSESILHTHRGPRQLVADGHFPRGCPGTLAWVLCTLLKPPRPGKKADFASELSGGGARPAPIGPVSVSGPPASAGPGSDLAVWSQLCPCEPGLLFLHRRRSCSAPRPSVSVATWQPRTLDGPLFP